MKRIIFDTDPGIDDAMALLFLGSSSSVFISSLTTIMGNASTEQCTRNALFLRKIYGLKMPVHKGSSTSINGQTPSKYPDLVHGKNGLADIVLTEERSLPDPGTAHSVMSSTAKKHPNDLTVLAVGQLTNVALAILKDKSFSGNLKEIVFMGGTINEPGNVTPWAEANIWGDPEAAEIIFKSGIPLTMVGLDVTMKTRITKTFLRTITSKLGKLGRFLQNINTFYADYYAKSMNLDSFPIHDSLAAMFVTNPDFFVTKKGILSVKKNGEERGRTLFEENQQGPHSVCLDVNADKVLTEYEKLVTNHY
ncbi:MAG: nucleoside hydrolase [Gammaproteobacteria bacterium]|nr:nucleoside hydrolase [Gammaproteobacteria bacterium]